MRNEKLSLRLLVFVSHKSLLNEKIKVKKKKKDFKSEKRNEKLWLKIMVFVFW
jgi:hypothetical protein